MTEEILSRYQTEAKNAIKNFGTYEEFWDYCFHVCKGKALGCSKGCGDRKRLKLPPFGGYKFKGEIKP